MKFISQPALKRTLHQDISLIVNNNSFFKMFWCNVLRRAGSDYCVNDISPGSFADFRLKIFTQEKISSYGDPGL